MTNKDSHTPDGRKPQATPRGSYNFVVYRNTEQVNEENANKPQAYRNTETGTIAWINQPYKDWVSIAPVLDTKSDIRINCTFTPMFCEHAETAYDLPIYKWLTNYTFCFPITITSLPEGWEPVEDKHNG